MFYKDRKSFVDAQTSSPNAEIQKY